jgi:hypothetical protein
MPILKTIVIDNFRSIQHLRLEKLGDLSSIVGLNSSGKSNVLRALNYFFNGEVDLGDDLDVDRDMSSYIKKYGKKFIAVSVEIDLNSGLNFEKHRELIDDLECQDSVHVRREISWDGYGQTYVESYYASQDGAAWMEIEGGQLKRLRTFIASIKFRYIPNNIDLGDLIDECLDDLRPLVAADWAAKIPESDRFIQSLKSAATSIFSDLFSGVIGRSHIEEIDVDVADQLPDLVFDMGLKVASKAGHAHHIDVQGSGTQSFVLLNLILLLEKKARSRAFGWRQGVILALDFANRLQESSNDKRNQIFTTSHAEEFAGAADVVVWLEQGDGGTVQHGDYDESTLPTLIKDRVVSFKPPLLKWTEGPIVLVEGPIDKLYISRAIGELELKPRWKIVEATEDLGYSSGGSKVKDILKEGKAALSSRPRDAFIVVLRDWEDKPEEYGKLLTEGTGIALSCPVDICNDKLDSSFVGIERYLPTSVILEACDGIESVTKKGIYRVNGKEFKGGSGDSGPKGRLYQRYSASPELSVGEDMKNLARWLDEQIEEEISNPTR